jgi:2-keto-4-pentenoate hydratase/2-oxohepta-3-ene-1,7-dioic acid hydratase in catechol pathway
MRGSRPRRPSHRSAVPYAPPDRMMDAAVRKPSATVGEFRDPQVRLRDGDVISVEIEGVGTLTNPVRTG